MCKLCFRVIVHLELLPLSEAEERISIFDWIDLIRDDEKANVVICTIRVTLFWPLFCTVYESQCSEH